MNLEKNLIKLLDKFIQKNRIEKSKYEIIIKKKEIYDGLIKLLDDNYDIMIQKQDIILTLLNQIYSNNDFYEDFKKMISEFDNIKSYRTNLIVEYNELLEDIEYYQLHFDENNSLIESAHRIKNSLKYNKLITTPEEDIKNIEKILNIMSVEYEVSDKDVLLYMNILKFHNDRKLAKTDLPEEQEYIEFKYSEIPNILNAGFQENDVIEVSINKKIILDMLAIEIIERISEFNEEEITELLSAFKKQYIYDNEYNYILLKMLDLYLDELIELYKLLLDKDIYTDEQSKEEVIEEYYNKLNKYLVINQYYNHSIEYTAIDEEISNDIEYKTEKKLVYSRSETNITKSRICLF